MKHHSIFNPNITLLLISCLVSTQAQATAILTADARYVDSFLGYYNVSGGDYRTPLFNYENWSQVAGGDGYACDGNGCSPVTSVSGSAGTYQQSGVVTDDIYSDPVLATGLFGFGNAIGYIDDPDNTLGGGNANADNVFSMSFTLLTAHAYNLTATLSAAGTGNATLQLGGINLSATGSPFALNGILDAGTYTLFARATAFSYPNESGSSSFDFNLTLTEVTAVPVPAAAWLLGSGLAVLVGHGTKRKSDRKIQSGTEKDAR